MIERDDCLEFENPSQWRAWLEEHHASASEVWVIHYKVKYKHLGLILSEAVEEALCFGWIDSKLISLDEKRYALRYSPRKRTSVWAISNIERVKKLIAEGRMNQVGLSKVNEAKQSGEWDAAIRREQTDRIPEELENVLQEIDGAIDAYQALPVSRKKQFIYWLQSTSRPETKQKRIQKIIEELIGR